MQMRQGPLVNSSRSFHQNIKRFFKKFLMFLKKSCQVFRQLFSEKPVKKLNYSSPLKAASSAALMICSISTSARFEVSTTT